MNFRSILDQIIEDNYDEAFKAFDLFFDETKNAKQELILLQGRLNALKKDVSSGTVGAEAINQERNKIRKSILQIFSKIESLVEEPDSSSVSEDNKGDDKYQIILGIIQNAVSNKYTIQSPFHSDQSSYYFKATKNGSFAQNDYYAIQVLNHVKIDNSVSDFNQEYLDFFSRCSPPFVEIEEFHPGNPRYLARKFIKGINLNNLLKSGIKLSLLKSIELILFISKGLKELDKRKIFYNHLIPDKIILDRNWDLHLLPLNIFEKNEHNITWKNLIDRIKYMSPEQLSNAGKVDNKSALTVLSNQFSLGLFLFFMLTGESLFDGKSLPDLYEDRIDKKETKKQIKDFFDTIRQNLKQYNFSDEKCEDFLSDFSKIFLKTINHKIEARYKRFDDFISELELLKIQIDKERRNFEGNFLYKLVGSFERAINSNEKLLTDFYNDLSSEITTKTSTENKNNRDFRFQYALSYVFTSISNLKTPEYMEEALSPLVKGLHYDFSIDEFEIFFERLKEFISENDYEWNEQIGESWDFFIECSLNAIDSILQPLSN